MGEQDETGNGHLADTVGGRLRKARESHGFRRADVAAFTKIAERHLIAIEEDRFSDLASRAYAVGFSRSYARAVGLDEFAIADAVRAQLDASAGAAEVGKPAVFEPGDPARVPPSRVAWVAGLGAVVLIVAIFLFWRSYFDPAVSLPDLAPPPAADQPSAAAVATPAAAPGKVTFTATAPAVWVLLHDADGREILEKELTLGESFTLPAGVLKPMLRTARPDALAITIDGQPVPPLSDRVMTMDVPVGADALRARVFPAPSPSATPAANVATGAVAAPSAPAPRAVSSPRAAGRPSPERATLAAPAPAPAAPPASPAATALTATDGQPSTVSE